MTTNTRINYLQQQITTLLEYWEDCTAILTDQEESALQHQLDHFQNQLELITN